MKENVKIADTLYGRGSIALADLREGENIMHYHATLNSKPEALQISLASIDDPRERIFCSTRHMDASMATTRRPIARRLLGRLLNHSETDDEVNVKPVLYGFCHHKFPFFGILFTAHRDIAFLEEQRFNYIGCKSKDFL